MAGQPVAPKDYEFTVWERAVLVGDEWRLVPISLGSSVLVFPSHMERICIAGKRGKRTVTIHRGIEEGCILSLSEDEESKVFFVELGSDPARRVQIKLIRDRWLNVSSS